MPYTIIKLPNSKVLHLKGVPKHAVSLIASHKLMDWGNLEQFIRSTAILLHESMKTTCLLCNSYIATFLGLELGKNLSNRQDLKPKPQESTPIPQST